MSKRQTLSLDYKIFHSEGRKVVKVRDTDTIMESEISELTKNLHSLAINCRSDVEDFFDTYDIDELENEEDLQNYISKIEGVKTFVESMLKSRVRMRPILTHNTRIIQMIWIN